MNTKSLIKQLQLEPHPEGGYYRETYRSNESITTPNGKKRTVSTAIYYLLENEDKSHFHRISSDELWFHHQGEAIEILLLHYNRLDTLLIGNDLEKGELPQARIPANTWFSARLKNAKGYSLVSCTVAPGFEFADFELAKREQLVQQYPQLRDSIELFTR